MDFRNYFSPHLNIMRRPRVKTILSVLISLAFWVSTTCYAEEKNSEEVNFVRPVAYSLSLMVIGYSALVLTDEIKGPRWETFENSFCRKPKFDDDSHIYNYVLHPLWGSETYIRAREAHFGMIGSLGFTLAASLAWEYLIESWSEPPSTQDLIFTAGAGWILGEIRYRIKNVSAPEYFWIIDPINTLLEHLSVAMERDGAGGMSHTVSFAWDF